MLTLVILTENGFVESARLIKVNFTRSAFIQLELGQIYSRLGPYTFFYIYFLYFFIFVFR